MTEAVGREVEPTEEGQTVLTAVCGQETPPLTCQVTDTGLVVVADLVDLVVVDFVVDLVVETLVDEVRRVVVWAVARARRRVVDRRENFILSFLARV